jgi:hypothetical protein
MTDPDRRRAVCPWLVTAWAVTAVICGASLLVSYAR